MMRAIIVYICLFVHRTISGKSITFHASNKHKFNPLIATLKQQSNGPSYSNTVIDTLAVDGWAVTFGTRRGLGEAAVPVLYQM